MRRNGSFAITGHAQPIPADSGVRSDLVIGLGHEAAN
jgi:hypothetical protein